MRIAHVDTGREWRGGQAQVSLLLEGLSERGHQVLLAAPDAALSQRARERGIEWLELKTGGDLDLGAGGRLARRLAAWQPELLHAHTARAHTVSRSAGRTLGVPVIVSRRVITPIARNPFSRRKYLSGIARYLCISRAVMDVLREGGVGAQRLALVPSAVDGERLAQVSAAARAGVGAESLRHSIGAAESDTVFGTAGAVTRDKGIDEFAAAAAVALGRHPQAWAVWIGEGRDRARLERLASAPEFGGRLRVLGFRADAHACIAQLDVFVSASRHEGLGTAILEAQALGVPVIATDSRGVRDSIEDGVNGRLVSDPRALGVSLGDALGDRATLDRWREQALCSVAEFSPRRMLDLTLAEYVNVRAEASSPAVD